MFSYILAGIFPTEKFIFKLNEFSENHSLYGTSIAIISTKREFYFK